MKDVALVQFITFQVPVMYTCIKIAWRIVIWYDGKTDWTIVNICCWKPFVMINIYSSYLNTSAEAMLDRQRSGIWMRFAIFSTFYQNILYSEIVTRLFKIVGQVVLFPLFVFGCEGIAKLHYRITHLRYTLFRNLHRYIVALSAWNSAHIIHDDFGCMPGSYHGSCWWYFRYRCFVFGSTPPLSDQLLRIHHIRVFYCWVRNLWLINHQP